MPVRPLPAAGGTGGELSMGKNNNAIEVCDGYLGCFVFHGTLQSRQDLNTNANLENFTVSNKVDRCESATKTAGIFTSTFTVSNMYTNRVPTYLA